MVRSEQMSKTWAAIVKGRDLEWSTVETLRSTRATRVAENTGFRLPRTPPPNCEHYLDREGAGCIERRTDTLRCEVLPGSLRAADAAPGD